MTASPGFARQVLDALPMTIYSVDLEGCITSANRAWSRFATANGAPGLAEEAAVVGRSIWDAVVDPALREQLERAMALLRAGQVPLVAWEFPCSSPEEERVFLMQVTATREPAPAGDVAPVAGFVFSTVDITPSHRSREALIETGIALSRTIALDRVLHEVGTQLRRALRTEAFVIAVADDDTAALRATHAWGYEEPAATLERQLAPVWLESLSERRVVVHHASRGLALTAPMTSAEGMIGAITVLSDRIGSPQQLDESMRVLATLAAQTAAAIDRAYLVRRVETKRRLEAIGEVAAGVAHELRNPLFGISSAAQLLRFRTRDDPVVEKNVGRILREVERLNRMVTALLEYGRPSRAHLAAGDPEQVWDDVLDAERGRLESKALILRRTRAAPAPACPIDAEQLRQVFLNVLVNAVDHAPEATDLTLQGQLLPNGGWRCRLHNLGPAVPPETLARAFEIFFSTKTGGTGIGLALCQRIVEEHGGTIALESAPECGTVLTVALPPAGSEPAVAS